MQLIDEGEFFKLSTDNRVESMKFLLKNLRKKDSWDKGMAVRKLDDQNIYKQKGDCKKFIKNVIRASNTEVVSVSERTISLTGKSVVIDQ